MNGEIHPTASVFLAAADGVQRRLQHLDIEDILYPPPGWPDATLARQIATHIAVRRLQVSQAEIAAHLERSRSNIAAAVTAVEERMGLSARSAGRFCAIASRLQPALAEAISLSDAEDNQAAIERVSRLSAEDQVNLARLLMMPETEGSLARAEAILFPTPRADAAAAALDKFITIWSRAKREVRKDWLRIHADEVRELLTEITNEGEGE